MAHTTIYSKYKTCPVPTIVRRKRIKPMQTAMKDMSAREHFILVCHGFIFSTTEFVKHDWYVQFQRDLTEVAAISDSVVLVAGCMGRDPHRLCFVDEPRKDFSNIDVTILKAVAKQDRYHHQQAKPSECTQCANTYATHFLHFAITCDTLTLRTHHAGQR